MYHWQNEESSERRTRRSYDVRAHRPAWSAILSRGMLAAVMAHAAAFLVWQSFEAPDAAPLQDVLTAVVVPTIQEVELPPAPGPIGAPTPAHLAVGLELAEALTEIVFTELEERWEIELPPPPILLEQDEWMRYLAFSPAMVRPQIRNMREVERFQEARYQPVFHSSGAVGIVEIQLWIDEEGIAQRARVAISSGLEILDRLAVELSRIVHFRPALHRGEAVPVNVIVPVHFRDGGIR